MTTAVILQSNYIPWKGYFDLIHDANVFVFYDDVQFTVRDWRTRNRIKTPQGLHWLSVPAGSDRNRLICEVVLADDGWQAKHWQTIAQNYRKCPYFGHYRPLFEELYLGHRWDNLSELNQTIIRRIAREALGITTEFRDAREFRAQGQKQDRLLDILGKLAPGVTYRALPPRTTSTRPASRPPASNSCGRTIPATRNTPSATPPSSTASASLICCSM